MANFGNNNLLGNQKRRHFIYNPALSRPRDRSSSAAQPVTSTSGALLRSSVPNVTHETPHKRFKPSHGLPRKGEEEFAAEEACRDLPVDAFDEELNALDEDFDDDLLTAEQLDECDRIASLELQTKGKDPSSLRSNFPQRNEQLSVSGSNIPSVSLHTDPGQDLSDDADSLATHCTQEYPVSSISHTSVSDMAEFPVSSSRMLRAPVVTHPQEHVDVVKPLKKDDSLLESFVGECNGSNAFVPNGNMDYGVIKKTTSLASDNHNNFSAMGDRSEDGQMEFLRKEIEKLKAEVMTAKGKVKTLEEEKFCKDGEIGILRDSLSHFEAEEKKRQGEVKAMEKQQARGQSQREKELEKQVENLTTQLQFKDREISQLIERNRKRAGSSTEANSTPQKKSVNLSEVFPTGSSFFQNTSPEAKVKSPRSVKPSVKDLKTPVKQNSQRISEGENSENTSLSGTSSGASSIERMKGQRREDEVSEREIVQLSNQSFPDVKLVQTLLTPQDKECHVPFQDPDNKTFDDGSIISLLTLDMPFANSQNITQSTAIDETGVLHTLHLFDTQATSRLQKSVSDIMQKDSSTRAFDNSLVLQTLSGLLNRSGVERSSLGDGNLPEAANFLPLLESHISRYVEQRTESNDDNIVGTCATRHSPAPDSPDSKDSLGCESEHIKNLAALQETALISLRLLNILVLHSSDVCECILKSARVFSEMDSSHDEDNSSRKVDLRRKMFSSQEEEGSFCPHPLFSSCKIAIKKDPDKEMMEVTTDKGAGERIREDAVQQTEILDYLFKLLVPQPKESLAVCYATLQVLSSLAKNCEVKYLTRMLPLLTDNLLSECLSRDWCLTSLSLVTGLLTSLTRHSRIVKRLCSQSDDCILLKVYQGWVFRPDDVPVIHYQEVHLQVVGFVNNVLSHSDSAILLFPLESECHCSLELIKCLVLMLDRVVTPLDQLPSDSLSNNVLNSHSLMLLRQGVFLLATLCLNDRLFVEHRVDVEHQYINVLSSVNRLYKRITGLISEAEVLAVQDLVDFEHVDGIEWSQESEDEIDETVEGMDVED